MVISGEDDLRAIQAYIDFIALAFPRLSIKNLLCSTVGKKEKSRFCSRCNNGEGVGVRCSAATTGLRELPQQVTVVLVVLIVHIMVVLVVPVVVVRLMAKVKNDPNQYHHK